MQSMSDYYSAIQLRSDRWSKLRETTDALAREPDGRHSKAFGAKIGELLDSLAPIEAYWAFPGVQAFDHIRRQFEHGNLDDVAFAVHRITRDAAEGDDHEDEAMLSPEARALTKPYFEVMIVDNVNEQQERWLKSNMQQMRRPDDQFTYEAVVVPSLQDALIGILFNHNIQAIVVRPGLTMVSKVELPILKRYLSRAGGIESIEDLDPEDYGPELCRLIARVR